MPIKLQSRGPQASHSSPKRRALLPRIHFVAVLASFVLVGTTALAYRPITAIIKLPSKRQDTAQKNTSPRSLLSARLSLEPEAERLSKRLGKRFLFTGKESLTVAGTLTLGGGRYSIIIERRQLDEGENIAVALNGAQPSLIWDDKEGARSSGNKATGIERTLIERLALDSPEQFIFAQLRGGAYNTVAHNVRPAAAGKDEDYNGPLWNLVRIEESDDPTREKSLSRWRLYHINAATGLIDMITSHEDGQTTVAEFSEWSVQDGETIPKLITWKRGGQPVMELSLTNISLGPRQ